MKKLLALCDSPTAETGFARVAKNLLPRWHKSNGGPFDVINVWAINYRGEQHTMPLWVFNGGDGGSWSHPLNLGEFLALLGGKSVREQGAAPYTHLWMMQDSFMLSAHKFPEQLKKICDAKKVRSIYYMPVDAPLDPEWMAIVQNVDATVCYTDYGKAEAVKALPKKFNPKAIGVLPHGCDTKIYYPRPSEERLKLRRRLFAPAPGQKEFLKDEDFLIVNVNANQRRKDIPRTMRIFKELLERAKGTEGTKVNFKLVLHMPQASADGTDLGAVATQLGLKEGVDWFCTGRSFLNGFATLGETAVAELYNAADLMLTTTLGEGWGFCLTEALGCGCPIAAPAHTSCLEIMRMADSGFGFWKGTEGTEGTKREAPVFPLPVEELGVVNAADNSRFRPTVDVASAAEIIWQMAKFKGFPRYSGTRVELPENLRNWLSWDRIAKEWEGVLLGS